MKLQARHAIVLVLLVGCGGASAAGTPASSPMTATPGSAPLTLDGQSFDVTLQIPDAPAAKDTLRFVQGKFESTACTALGFPEWSDYAVQPAGDAIAFHVLTKHPAGTTMDWNGSIKGGTVDGTANRLMNGKTDVIRFKGSLQR